MLLRRCSIWKYVDGVLHTEQHCCTAGPELRCMCFCTTGFETYAAYTLLVAKALWRDGMVYVLLLLVSIPDSSFVLRTHKPIRNCVYLFIMMLSFQLSKVTYLSTQLLVYMPTEAPVHQPTSSFFSPFGLTCTLTCELICWSMYPQTYLLQNKCTCSFWSFPSG